MYKESIKDKIVKDLSIELFNKFKFMPGLNKLGHIRPVVEAWNIPFKQRIDNIRDEKWHIYCPYLEDGKYTTLIKLVENKISSDLLFYLSKVENA